MSNLALTSGFNPTNIDEAMRLSDILSRSQMVPKIYQNKPEDIMVATMWGREMGLAPMQALQNIAVINGKPSVYGDAALALVQNSPVCEDIEESIEGDGTPNPVAVCIAKRKNRKPVTAKFSVEDAKRAGLWGKQGPWTQYPKRMLQMRARGFALRDAFPDVLKGLITAEEAFDYPTEATPAPVAEIVSKADSAIVDMQSDQIGSFPVYLPDGSIYSRHDDAAGWIASYAAMIKKIVSSAKLTEVEKMDKMNALKSANVEVTDEFDSFHKTKLRAEIIKAGATSSPKLVSPPSEADMEPNETES